MTVRAVPFRVEVGSDAVIVTAVQADDALRIGIAQVCDGAPWKVREDDIGWGGQLPDGRLVTRYHLDIDGRGTVVVTVTPVAS